jgi:hypothetical protein
VTKNNEAVLYEARHRNGYNLNPLTRIYWRASLVPAAAVIPAPIAYIKVVAVKKLVVGSAAEESGPPLGGYCFSWPNSPVFPWCSSLSVIGGRNVYFEKIRVLKAGVCLNSGAWNNEIGYWFCFIGSELM